jgi:hypothetical protein
MTTTHHQAPRGNEVTKKQIAEQLVEKDQGLIESGRLFRWYMTMTKAELVEFGTRHGIVVR